MFSLPRFMNCGAFLATLTILSNVAISMPTTSFQFGGGALQVKAGTDTTPAEITFVSDFSIISQNGELAGDLVGLTGDISGIFQFDNPLGANSVSLFNSTAPNVFSITNGIDSFTAVIDLFKLEGGGGGAIVGAIDFSSSSYNGTNTGLMELHSLVQNLPDLTVTFQTLGGSGVNLDELFANGSGGVGSYSAVASVNSIPSQIAEPATIALLALGLLCGSALVGRQRLLTSTITRQI